jgi:Zn-dependent protease
MFHNFDLNQLVVMIVPLLMAVTIHEVAHGYVALRLGDNTAKLAGRLTLNPLKHLDITGSLILPVMLKILGSPVIFGYAKPVPVNFYNLRNPRRATVYVSAAGVSANLAMVMASGLLFRALLRLGPIWSDTILSPILTDLFLMLGYSVLINTVLAVFNLLPIPPLDGSRILAAFLPKHIRMHYARLERFGILILFFLLFIGGNTLFKVISLVMAPVLKLAFGTDGITYFLHNTGEI